MDTPDLIRALDRLHKRVQSMVVWSPDADAFGGDMDKRNAHVRDVTEELRALGVVLDRLCRRDEDTARTAILGVVR